MHLLRQFLAIGHGVSRIVVQPHRDQVLQYEVDLADLDAGFVHAKSFRAGAVNRTITEAGGATSLARGGPA